MQTTRVTPAGTVPVGVTTKVCAAPLAEPVASKVNLSSVAPDVGAMDAMEGRASCTRKISSPAVKAPLAADGTKTSQPSFQDVPEPLQDVPFAEAQITTFVDRLTASERAKRKSLTMASAAASTLRLTSIVRKLGTASEANTAAIATVTSNSINVKPYCRFFMKHKLPWLSANLQHGPDIR